MRLTRHYIAPSILFGVVGSCLAFCPSLRAASPFPQPVSTADLAARINSLERKVDNQPSKPKDIWDIANSVSGLVTGVFIGGLGIFFTQQYNRRQARLLFDKNNADNQLRQQEVDIQETATRIKALEVIRDFMPDLKTSNSEEVKNIILLIDRLVGSRIPGAVLGETLNSFCKSQDEIRALGKQMAINRLDEILKRLELFQPHMPISALQENPSEPGLQQNPYLCYVVPLLSQISNSEQISGSVPNGVLSEIDKVARNPDGTIVEIKAKLESIISDIKESWRS